jgi:murein DD-endopeptidase MepM/ murein hydrolase activator NlpD
MRDQRPDDSQDLVTLMLVPGRSGNIRRFNVRRRLLRNYVVGAAVLALGIVAMSVDYVRVRLSVVELGRMRVETRAQREQLETYASRIEELSQSLTSLRRFDHKLRVITNLDPGDGLPLTGLGGIEGEGLESHHLSGLTRAQRDARMMESMDRLAEISEEQEESFKELIAHLENQTAKLSHTPSISPTKGWITSGFGYRVSPFTKKRELHRGIDIAGRMGTPIISPADGRVRYAGPDRGLGNSVIVRHGYGVETVYGHLSEILVKAGEKVKRGDRVGLMGSTGRSTGPHLHYQVNVSGVAVNPRNYMLD